MKSILNLNYNEALIYFLKKENYFTLELPSYFDFQKIIDEAYNKLKNKELENFCKKNTKSKPDYPKNYENVNYKILSNKNGEYDWRPFEIIHPFLYVDLVQEICKEENWNLIKKRFLDFQKNKKIICCSIPLQNSNKKRIILNWWNKYEQKSISNGLIYKYLACTDITNCYASVYTHIIPWALHTRNIAKQNKDTNLIGNVIDTKIRNMNFGQTNGIPQGSVLMDFIAEIILGYADELIGIELENAKIENFQILRYRDDYRIFAMDRTTIDKILKIITEILASLNLKLNSNKTNITNDIINGSIKKDKISRLTNPVDKSLNIQKKLLIIYNFSLIHPNSGSLKYLLTEIYKEHFLNVKTRPNSYDQVISIIISIMHKNPYVYSICVGILSEIFKFLNTTTRDKYINLILEKFEDVPNSNYIEIWLQRLTILDNRNKNYNSLICQKLYNDVPLWNSSWLNIKLDETSIINEDIINSLTINVSEKEINNFNDYLES